MALYLQGYRPRGGGADGEGDGTSPAPVAACHPLNGLRRSTPAARPPPCLIVSPGTSFQRPSLQRDVIKPGGTATGLMTSGCRAEQHHAIHSYIFTHMSTK